VADSDSAGPLSEALRRHLRDIASLALEHPPNGASLLLYDTGSPLSRLLASAYREALPSIAALDAGAASKDEAFAALGRLSPGDLVVLVQSVRFPFAEHRFRVELFDRGLKVVEHPHLGKVAEDEIPAYVDSLAYDPAYYRPLGMALKDRIDAAENIRLTGDGFALLYTGGFEPAKLNVGDYRGQKHVGGQFPIGEVFTEPRDLRRVSGTVKLFAFGDQDFAVRAPAIPILLEIEEGQIAAAPGAPPDFVAVLDAIRAEEERVWIRELGLGLNRGLRRDRRVGDIGAYERMCGVHISLGAKHALFAKEGFVKRRTRFHVDVFPAVDRVEIDGERVFEDGAYSA